MAKTHNLSFLICEAALIMGTTSRNCGFHKCPSVIANTTITRPCRDFFHTTFYFRSGLKANIRRLFGTTVIIIVTTFSIIATPIVGTHQP